jgi:vanillate O-demethylase ferredoxin subunit
VALDIGRPRNRFVLEEGAGPVLLLAGGIGITPLLGMAEHLFAAGRRFALHYCTTTAARAAFADVLRAAPYAASVTLHHGDEHGLCDLGALLAQQSADTHAYVCGPHGFIAAATSHGWPAERWHVERFCAPAVAAAGGAIEVQAGRGGPVVTVAPGTPITIALERAGIVIPVSCEQGVCGTCVTRVLEGEPEHRDFHLSAQEHAHGFMLPCCSWAKSGRLVLDL